MAAEHASLIDGTKLVGFNTVTDSTGYEWAPLYAGGNDDGFTINQGGADYYANETTLGRTEAERLYQMLREWLLDE